MTTPEQTIINNKLDHIVDKIETVKDSHKEILDELKEGHKVNSRRIGSLEKHMFPLWIFGPFAVGLLSVIFVILKFFPT